MNPRHACRPLLLGLALVASASAIAPAMASADRSFSTRFSVNDTGDIAFVGNTLMTCPDSALCTQARNGTATPISNLQNNSYAMTYVDVDSSPSTFNSSTASMSLPAGSQVLFAGLYWGGDTSGSGSNAAPNASDRDEALFKAPGDSSYRTVTATTLDTSSGSGRYQGFADVTAIVAAAGNGTYAAANVQAAKGNDRYAIWQLVVAYRDTTQPARNLTVFDGLVSINGSSGATIPVSGFRTPPSGAVKTTLGFITYEGDLGIEGDSASLNGTPLQDALNPRTNFFNSTISNRGSRVTTKSPDYINQLGIDADLFNADGILANNATSASIQVTTSGDVYYPGVLTFATELYAPRIEQTKTFTDLNGGAIEQGDILEYRIAATNNGQDGAVGFTLRDPIPVHTAYVPGSLRVVNGAGAATGVRTDVAGDDNGEFDGPGNRVVARLGSGANATQGGKVAVGSSYDVRFRVRVADRLAPDTEITNTATASFFSESMNTPLTAASTPVLPTVVKSPDLAITKSHSGPLTPGGSATYRFDVRNAGNAPVHGTTTTVADTLPAELTPTSASGAGWSCAIAGQTVTCSRSDDLADGASYPPITLAVDVDPGAGASIDNVATVSNPADGNPVNDSSLDPRPTSPSADLAITKSASPATVNVGGQVTFTLAVSNNGPSVARNVSVLDSLPAGLELVSVTPSQGSCNATISCALGTIARNGNATVTVLARARSDASGSTLRNSASVSGDQPDPTPANNSATADVAVAGADLAIEKTISDEHPSPGSAVRYTLVVRNDGPSSAAPVVVRDALPAKLHSVSSDRGECAVSGNDVLCTFPSLAAGASETIHVDATVAAGADGALDNTASVSGPGADPDPTDNSSTSHAAISGSADLAITKSTDRNSAAVGDQITYTLAVHNAGPSVARAARIVDALPAGVAYVSASPGCGESAGTVTCALGDLAAGGDATRTITVRVGAGAVGTLTNAATVRSDSPDPNPGNDEDHATTQVGSSADLSLTKSVAPAQALPGDTVTYTLTVRNDGPAAATDVVLGDTLPGGVTFVSSDPAAPTCAFAGGAIDCDLGTIAAGGSRTVTVRATVDALASADDHRHLLTVEKVEQQVDLDAGQVRSDLTLSCPQAGAIMTDATVRVDAVDQGTGTLASVETREARSTAPGSYEFTVANNAGGRAQAKLFGVCMPSVTEPEAGHSHRVLLSDVVTVTETLQRGRSDVTVPCGPGTTAVAPGIEVSGGEARLVGSEPSGNGRRFTVEAPVDATTVELSARCLSLRLDTAAGHSHDLALNEVHRTVTVPANSTVSESVICGDLEKGIVASYDLPPGLLLVGHDPQPKSRAFKLVNPTGAPLNATIDLMCIGDRTGGPVVSAAITNAAAVTSPTPDPDVDDRVAGATLAVSSAPEPPPPAPPPTPTPSPPGGGDAAGNPTVAAGRAKVSGRGVAVAIACDGGDCAGTVELRSIGGGRIAAGLVLGRSTFALGDGERATERVRLKRFAMRLVRAGELRRAEAVLTYADGSTEARVVRLRTRRG